MSNTTSSSVNSGGKKGQNVQAVKPTPFAFNSNGLAQDQAQQIWNSLRNAIKEIQCGNQSKLRFEELYRNAYTLVLHKQGDMLYEGVEQCVVNQLKTVSEIVKNATNDLLDICFEQWDRHKLTMSMIRDILMYMDKTHCKQKGLVPVYDLGLLLFRDHVLRNPTVAPRLKHILLDNIQREREGEVIDRVLMKNSLAMLVDVNCINLEVYMKDFEKDFLQQTRNYYCNESQKFMSENTVPDYLRKIEARIRQEENRADTYLDKSTKPKLRAVIQDELIVKYAKRLVEDEKTGCIPMFENNQTEDLLRMYQLFSRETATLDHIRETMSNLIKKIGTAIVQDKENLKNPKLFVQLVLDCRTKFNGFVDISFRQDKNFAKALKESLEYFINLDSRAAQYLSLYTDDMLKKRIKGVTDTEIEQRLNNVISIFRYLQDKDIFEDFYKQHLAQRLLTGTSVNSEVEKMMIAKLKAECGVQFTSRLEGMFKDMELSKSLMKTYQTSLSQHNTGSSNDAATVSSASSAAPTELNVTVLTTGFWPIQSVYGETCILPKEASSACEAFQKYYCGVHSGRRLTWQTSLGTAELRAQFDGGRKELIVHTYQMIILMLFNSKDNYTYADLLKLTGIPEAELSRHLLSLAHPQVRVLRKMPNNKTMAPDHKFFYNTKYTSKLFRNKIPLLSKTVTNAAPSNDNVIPPAVLEARKNCVEAAVVRIMKARKTLDHNNLMAEVVKQLASKFPAEPSFIKKRIESLIEREYLERDKENRRLYQYLA